jgi:ribokinase
MFPDHGANDRLAAGDLADDLLAAGRHLHVAGYALLRPGSRAAAQSAIARARAREMTVSVDPSSAALLSPGFLELARGASLLLPNAAEARALTGEPEREGAARLLVTRFSEVIVKLGADGVLWTDGRDLVRAPAAPITTVIDSTGAGDAFAAGLIAARMRGADLEQALDAGCRLAAEAVGRPGGRPALPAA